MKNIITLPLICIALFVGTSAFSQKTFVELNIVEPSNVDKPIGNISCLDVNSEKTYFVRSEKDTVSNADINKSILAFLNVLQPEKSYIIQDGVEHYFMFQYDEKQKRYLVMGNHIGNKNEAIYCETFSKAQEEMFVLLQKFYAR